jgi:adenine-specific DNA-methyltransferase
MTSQIRLFETRDLPVGPPSTRYQGSKFKLLPWLWHHMGNLRFDSALDAFGGTGCVAYMLKSHNKAVTYNDNLKFNYLNGKALIENSSARLSDDDVRFLFLRHRGVRYSRFIEKTFRDIYFTTSENEWLDVVCQNIPLLKDEFKRAMAFYALFQACIRKRPYNLFHRKNLYIRMANVNRGFGNKTTWDRPFEKHFVEFVEEINNSIFDSGCPCRAMCCDAAKVEGNYDLVYIDPPYLNKNGVGVDYLEFYHFLEGITDYPNWANKLNHSKKHKPLKGGKSPWCDMKQILGAFDDVFERFAHSILVVSYRSDGIPSEEELMCTLKRYKSKVRTFNCGEYRYVLSTNSDSKEMLLIGE